MPNSKIPEQNNLLPPQSNGNWHSAITADLIVSDNISIDECRLTTKALYYIERRPQQSGRCLIVKQNGHSSCDLLPEPYSARSRVHEYGGGCYCIGNDQSGNDIIYFVNDADQDIYRITKSTIERITKCEDRRFADFVFDENHQQLISICETHIDADVINSIVSIDINSGKLHTLVQGSDFYASPRLNSSSTQLCWQSWKHPNMPWDGNQLWLADMDVADMNKGPETASQVTLQLSNQQCIAGGDDISIFQPQWSPDDILFFISDDTGWWQLYRYFEKNAQQLTFGEKEFGLPQWVFAQSSYAFANSSTIICCYQTAAQTFLASLELEGDFELSDIKTQWQDFSSISACQDKICFIAASARQFPQLISASLAANRSDKLEAHSIKETCHLAVSDDYFSAAQNIDFINRHQQKVYANYYPPCNPDYSFADTTEKQGQDKPPPLIVICHGGPSGQAGTALDPKKQFWTSRGFALLDVNYSGSTGFGRAYRNRLDKRWGLLDVQDCCDAALPCRHLRSCR